MSMGRILTIDDEKNIRHLIQSEFSLEGFDVVSVRTGEEGLKIASDQKFDVVLLDIKLPRMSGLEVLKRLKEMIPDLPVFMITGFGDIKSAVESLKLGAQEYVTKPFKLDELLGLVKKVIKTDQVTPEVEKFPVYHKPAISTAFVTCPSMAMKETYALMQRVAVTDKTVLIQGETGVGKDVLAYQIHLNSLRKNGPFITVDCGLLNKNLAESELYGHRKGSFSGATERKIGLVEQSNGGTLFLDEMGNIDMEIQKKFLRILETSRFRRVGETKESHIDTRFILATNLDLNEAVRNGSMRMDLFYRMDMIRITVPPLRDRPEDVGPLVKHFVKMESATARPASISSEALAALERYSWPGNVRELRSVTSKALIFAKSETIALDDLPSHVLEHRAALPRESKKLEDIERQHIIAVLEKTGGNQSEAAKVLGINRKTLYKKIHKYSIF